MRFLEVLVALLVIVTLVVAGVIAMFLSVTVTWIFLVPAWALFTLAFMSIMDVGEWLN